MPVRPFFHILLVAAALGPVGLESAVPGATPPAFAPRVDLGLLAGLNPVAQAVPRRESPRLEEEFIARLDAELRSREIELHEADRRIARVPAAAEREDRIALLLYGGRRLPGTAALREGFCSLLAGGFPCISAPPAAGRAHQAALRSAFLTGKRAPHFAGVLDYYSLRNGYIPGPSSHPNFSSRSRSLALRNSVALRTGPPGRPFHTPFDSNSDRLPARPAGAAVARGFA